MKVDAEIIERMAAALNELAPTALQATPSPDSIRIRAGLLELSQEMLAAHSVEIHSRETDGYVTYELDVEQFAKRALNEVQELMIQSVARGG